MIIWLASYPRSGNTLLRTMIWQAFGKKTFSAYNDKFDLATVPEVQEGVGHQLLAEPFADFYEREKNSPDLYFVKTHDVPIDDGWAIYVIRDGRSAIVSWYNLLVRLKKRTDVSISDLILGRTLPFGNWSEHVQAWNPRSRPRTLLLSYQALLQNPEQVLSAISKFTNLPITGPWQNNFDEMHQKLPGFFHRGSDEKNNAQMSPEENALFFKTHADCMKQFGFGSE